VSSARVLGALWPPTPEKVLAYIWRRANRVSPEIWALSCEVYAAFMPVGEEGEKARKRVYEILRGLRALGLVEMNYVDYADRRGVPWFTHPAYRVTPKGMAYLAVFGREILTEEELGEMLRNPEVRKIINAARLSP